MLNTLLVVQQVGAAAPAFGWPSSLSNPHVMGHVALGLNGSHLLAYAGGALLLGVVLPAVWSRDPERREAALKVLDRILRFLRPRN
jgi:hypothetical protein